MSVTSSKLENCEKFVSAKHKSQREQTKKTRIQLIQTNTKTYLPTSSHSSNLTSFASLLYSYRPFRNYSPDFNSNQLTGSLHRSQEMQEEETFKKTLHIG